MTKQKQHQEETLEEKINKIEKNFIYFEDCSDISMKVSVPFPNGDIQAQNEYCIYYAGSVVKSGYPYFNGKKVCRLLVMHYKNQGKTLRGHGQTVRHMCANKKCVNINHLEIGTCRDNMKDKMFHGMSFAKKRTLTRQEVIDIRESYSKGEYKQIELAEMYGLNRRTISNIVNGALYKDVGGPITINYTWENLKRSLSDLEVKKIKALLETNLLTYEEITKIVPKASKGIITKIASGLSYKNI